MTEPVRIPAPQAVGDIVAGEPPVPITVWHVPAARAGETLSITLAERLVANFTHGRRLVLDLTDGEQMARAATAARRRCTRHQPDDLASGEGGAALIVTGWPTAGTDAERLLTDCAGRLMLGGCVAVVLGAGKLTVNQILIGAARAAGLTYLQHVVAAHDLTEQLGQPSDDRTHVRVHSDVLIFYRFRTADADA